MPKSKAKKKSTKANDPEALLEQAAIALNRLDYDLALMFYERAQQIEPNNTDIMDAMADTYLQKGDTEVAYDLLQKSTTIAPNKNPYKWLYLAQLQEGKSSLTSYETAIPLLLTIINDPTTDETALASTKRELSRVYSSISELFLTDLCFETDAERRCEEAATSAIHWNPTSLDGQQVLASLRLSQSRPHDAAAVLRGLSATVKELIRGVNERSLIEELRMSDRDNAHEAAPDTTVTDFPGTEACLSVAKLMLECHSSAASVSGAPPITAGIDNKGSQWLVEESMEILVGILEQDDQNIDTWYVMGVAAMLTDPPDCETAQFHLDTAKTMIEAAREAERARRLANGEDGGEPLDRRNDGTAATRPCDGEMYEELYQRVLGSIDELRAKIEKGEGVLREAGAEGMDVEAVPEDEEWSEDEDASGSA